MVAISTDAPRWQGSAPHHSGRPPALRLAPAVDAAEPLTPASRLLLVIGVVVLTLVVAASTVAVGRVLDGQRGIPAAGSAPVVVDQAGAPGS